MRNRQLIRRSPRRGRGAQMLMFVMLVIPLWMLFGALAYDYSAITMSQNEAAHIAEEAAIAAAWQTAPDSQYLDPWQAQEAVDTLTRGAVQAGAAPHTSGVTSTLVLLAGAGTPPGSGSAIGARVTVNYMADTSIFTRMLTGLISMDTPTGFRRSVTRDAFVCIPGGLNTTSGGSCARPDALD